VKFIETPLKGAFVIEPERIGDARGFFARIFCKEAFEAHGLETGLAQANNSKSARRGTLRGLHYQLPPMEETKLVRCIKGALWEVVLDLREGSATFGRSFGTELTEENRRMLFVPKGCAHGFITLEEESEMLYLVSQFYSPELERGVRWDDPAFNIRWPIEPQVISERDRNHPNYEAVSV